MYKYIILYFSTLLFRGEKFRKVPLRFESYHVKENY